MTNNLFTALSKYREYILFAVVGIINTCADFSVFSIMVFISNEGSKQKAQAAGYLTGLICSFFLNKYVTFKNNVTELRQVVLFLICNGITIIVSMFVLYWFHSVMGLQEHFAKLLFVTPITMFINFLSYKFIVFSKAY